MSSVWTEERVEKLIDLHSKSWSCSQIAAGLGCGITRNAVIGRLHRMGITGGNVAMSDHERVKNHRASEDRKLEKRKQKRREMREQGIPPAPRIRLPLRPLLTCVEVVSRMITLLDLEPDDCRYPDGEGAGITFCGHPKLEGRSYCFAHTRLTLSREPNWSRGKKESALRERRAKYSKDLLEAAE